MESTRTRWHLHVFGLALLVVLAGAVREQTIEKRTLPGVTNYTRVDATVGCGGATTPAAMRELKREGFVTIVNVRLATEPGANVEEAAKAAEEVGLRYVHIPLDGTAPDPAAVDRILRTVTTKDNQPVYIHCASGNRVGAVWLIKRVLADGWAVERAEAEARIIGLSSERLRQFAIDYIAGHRQ